MWQMWIRRGRGNCMLMVPTAIFSTDVGSQCWFTNVTPYWQGCNDICYSFVYFFFQLKIISKAMCLFLVRVMLICVCSDPLWLGFHSSWWMRQIVNVSVTKWLYLFISPAVSKIERVAQQCEGEKEKKADWGALGSHFGITRPRCQQTRRSPDSWLRLVTFCYDASSTCCLLAFAVSVNCLRLTTNWLLRNIISQQHEPWTLWTFTSSIYFMCTCA